jgi:hypothetical protein
MLTANSTNDTNFNPTTTNTSPLPHRDLLHPKVNYFISFSIKNIFDIIEIKIEIQWSWYSSR